MKCLLCNADPPRIKYHILDQHKQEVALYAVMPGSPLVEKWIESILSGKEQVDISVKEEVDNSQDNNEQNTGVVECNDTIRQEEDEKSTDHQFNSVDGAEIQSSRLDMAEEINFRPNDDTSVECKLYKTCINPPLTAKNDKDGATIACSMCDRVVLNYRSVKREHILRHLPRDYCTLFECAICGFHNRRKNYVQRHLKLSHAFTPGVNINYYITDNTAKHAAKLAQLDSICFNTAQTRSKIGVNGRKLHQAEPKPLKAAGRSHDERTCKMCGQIIKPASKRKMRAHLFRHLPTTAAPFACSACGKTDTSLDNIKSIHIKTVHQPKEEKATVVDMSNHYIGQLEDLQRKCFGK